MVVTWKSEKRSVVGGKSGGREKGDNESIKGGREGETGGGRMDG